MKSITKQYMYTISYFVTISTWIVQIYVETSKKKYERKFSAKWNIIINWIVYNHIYYHLIQTNYVFK
jgi:hypothetical protein